MKQVFTFILVLLTSTLLFAQTKVKQPVKYDMIVNFTSMCCGTASDDFLQSYVKKFSKKNKVTIPAHKASGCGKEGEYKIMFQLNKLKASVRKKFISETKSLVAKQDKKNREKDSSSGPINIEYNIPSSEVSFCRGGITKW